MFVLRMNERLEACCSCCDRGYKKTEEEEGEVVVNGDFGNRMVGGEQCALEMGAKPKATTGEVQRRKSHSWMDSGSLGWIPV